MMRVRAAGHSDVGRQREANEDAFHVGDSIFAVADGMGGHVAGEIASSTALGPVTELDGRVFSDGTAALSALRDAVVEANQAVVAKARKEPSYQGMGTTLTATLIEGRRAHVAHVGDSRAYLVRNGVFSQLTTDHTLVQRLIDEGRLTQEEAARHPQRSVITRAIGVEADVDVDAMSLDLEPGDTVLLCSDGLTGPVDDEVIAEILQRDDVDDVVHALIEVANRNGGPDNITCVVLRLEELETAPTPRRPSATSAPLVVSTRPDADEDDWAGRLGRLGDRTAAPDGDAPRRTTTRGQRITAIVVAVGLALGAVLAGGRWLLSRSYYLGLGEETVTIFQGVPTSVGPFDLSWEFESTTLRIDDLPPFLREELEDGVAATSPEDARTLVATYRNEARADDEPTEEPSADDAPDTTTTTPVPGTTLSPSDTSEGP